MSIKHIGAVPHDVAAAIERAVKPLLHSQTGEPQVLVFHGSATIDIAVVREALKTGATITILDAKAGHLADLDPGTGCDVSADMALFALKRTPIPGHAGKFHTVVTMLPDPASIHVEVAAMDETGQTHRLEQPHQPSLSADAIAEELKRHVAIESLTDSNLIPPAGAFYGVVTYNLPWSNTITQGWWPEASGATQTTSSRTALTYYVYFANGAAQAPQYVVLLVESGTAIPANGGTSGLCSYDNGERAFGLGTNTISNTVLSGGLALVAQSPSATTSTPVMDTIDYPMTVMALDGGGKVSTPFTAAITTYTDNADWGVTQTGNPAANEAAWMYYNITGWNAATQLPGDFANWWRGIYSDNDTIIQFDSQCANGASFHAVAVWTISQNPGNQGPLSVQFQYTNTMLLEGFVNAGNSGVNHHQLAAPTCVGYLPMPTWDLVALTGSNQ